MAKIIQLDINHYRGIKEISLRFSKDENLICLIGRGDSGKTTIVDAISSVLSPSWNLNFYDTDFYGCNHTKNIEILASLIDIPEKFLSEYKFGLHMRGLNIQTNEIIDDVTLEDTNQDIIPVLTIKLIVDSSLEPRWFITNTRKQEDKSITSAERSQFNCYLISDYIDRHFSWNKGNPLYALLKSTISDHDFTDNNIVIQHLREAKDKIDKSDFENLNTATEAVMLHAAELGLDISKISTTIDSRELSIKDGRISLHEDVVPFRQKGKGSKRIASIAIQSALVREGGVMLIDEIEQGLEPDRVKQVVRSLKGHHAGQIFVTTHSRDAVTELGSKPLLFLLKDKETDDIEKRSFSFSDENLQKTIRACPEAFFAKKVIVCEGATEVGICRAMDKWRRTINKPQMSFKDCAYVDGTGSTIAQRVEEINEVGLETALFCDSDQVKINDKKNQWKLDGISIFDCDDTLCLEQQVFMDLPWGGVKELVAYVANNHKKGQLDAVRQSVSVKFTSDNSFPDDWQDADTPQMRDALASASIVRDKEWFKSMHHGEALGNILFKYIDSIQDGTRLKNILIGLSGWVDK